MAKRNLYLTNVPVEEALGKYLAALEGKLVPGVETVETEAALGRVTWDAVFARRNSPLYNAAAMDGIALVAAKTAGAREDAPVTLQEGEDFKVVDTGDPVNPPFDAVIMAEDLIELDDGRVKILAAAPPWQHVRPVGEDIAQGEMILPGRHRIRPIDIGVLLSGGITRIEVYAKPKVAVFPTGNEIIEPSQTPAEGDVIESNSRMLCALVREDGGVGERLPVIPDDYDAIKAAVQDAVETHDAALVNAGSSAGTEDFTARALRELGEVVVHGAAMKPGKPVILAVVRGKPVIGIPGYPVSAYLAYRVFVSPVLARLTGRREAESPTVKAVASRRMVSSLKHREYVRVKVGLVDGKLAAAPLARGAGAAMSLVRADGFCVIPQNSEGVEAGETVEAALTRPLPEIEQTLVCTGSHDLILDLIADRMSRRDVFLASAHVGSLGGLMALKRGECHIAPTHLLDEETGEYNRTYLRRLFPEEPVALIKGVGRVQGIMTSPGNPLGIRSAADLTRCTYINRQRGAGTRLFLDFQLKTHGLSGADIRGYEREAATHMAVAAAVKAGNADAGMGVSSAAIAMGLGFIPLGNEEYDFAILPRFLGLEMTQVFLEILRSDEFRAKLDSLGGYTYAHCGEIQDDLWTT